MKSNLITFYQFFDPEDRGNIELSEFITILREVTSKIDMKDQEKNDKKSLLFDMFLDNLYYSGVIKRDSEIVNMENLRQCLISRNISPLDIMDLIIEIL